MRRKKSVRSHGHANEQRRDLKLWESETHSYVLLQKETSAYQRNADLVVAFFPLLVNGAQVRSIQSTFIITRGRAIFELNFGPHIKYLDGDKSHTNSSFFLFFFIKKEGSTRRKPWSDFPFWNPKILRGISPYSKIELNKFTASPAFHKLTILWIHMLDRITQWGGIPMAPHVRHATFISGMVHHQTQS